MVSRAGCFTSSSRLTNHGFAAIGQPPGLLRYLGLQAAAADGAHGAAVERDQHARTGAAVGRAFDLDHGGEHGLAVVAFERAKCDVAVLEVGMGGRLDATNVVRPVAALITPIGLDHTEYLGNTLRKIASEKAGVIHR